MPKPHIKYKIISSNVEAEISVTKVWTDGQTDGRTRWLQYNPLSTCGGIIIGLPPLEIKEGCILLIQWNLSKIESPWRPKRVWRYQRDNPNLYIEEEQTTQWLKEKVQKDKQGSTNHTHKTKDWVTLAPLKTGGELRCYERVSSSCSTQSSLAKGYDPLYSSSPLASLDGFS